MAVLLEAPLGTGSAAVWTTNQDVTAGSVDTDAVTAAAATSQSTFVDTGNSADGTSGANIITTGTSTSVTGIGASGTVTVRSGPSTASGNNGGASGAILVQSGNTTTTTAHVGGPTGNVVVQSGDASLAGGGTSGASGSVAVESGTSASGNSGTVTVQSGDPTAAGTSGNLVLSTGSTTGAGIAGNIVITPGTTVAGTNGATVATGLRTLSVAPNALTNAGQPFTLTAADSGGIFSVDQAGVVAITIPAAAVGNAGVSYFFAPIAGASICTIASDAADIRGVFVNATGSAVATGTTISIQATAIDGDSVELKSTGVNWIMRAVTSAAAGAGFTIA
jgi:hypothetical protein